MTIKVQRIRDPVHNLIEFGATPATRELEMLLWEVVQTPQFQRLRRIKQLGFSELVFPGATHTRFAHSIGVFHTARQLLAVIERTEGTADRAKLALAAALVHDIGHGMFSHAFEAVGKARKLPMAQHADVSAKLIRDSEIAEIFRRRLTTSFADDVADLIGREQPRDVYDAVVTSQFDADRLDYMQRDRMMTGVQSGGVDVTWLLNNLQVAPISNMIDNEKSASVDTLVLGPKAFYAAESYVLALFHLYPNVYFHKATRGAEMVLRTLVLRLFALQDMDCIAKSGLPRNHPLVRFVAEPHSLERAQALDDTVFWGALPMLAEAEDHEITVPATQLRDRKLLECVDLWGMVADRLSPEGREDTAARRERIARINLACDRIKARQGEVATALLDDYTRNPYKRFQDSQTPPNQIHIMQAGRPRDMAEISSVVAEAEPFRVFRAYAKRDDTVTKDMLQNIVRTECVRDDVRAATGIRIGTAHATAAVVRETEGDTGRGRDAN